MPIMCGEHITVEVGFHVRVGGGEIQLAGRAADRRSAKPRDSHEIMWERSANQGALRSCKRAPCACHAGREAENVMPVPGFRMASSVPPWAATIARLIESPSPMPSRLVV